MSITKYKSDHLFLLIGENPLPNYVAAKLLAKGRDGAKPTLYLVFSEGSRGTKAYAKQLKEVLGEDAFSYEDVKIVDPSSARSIREAIAEKFPESGGVGLHYTGGTKAMAVHAYNEIEDLAAEKNLTAYFSYLDARNLLLRFDKGDEFKLSNPNDTEDGALFQQAAISLQDLLRLHGLKPRQRSTPNPHSQVFMPEVVEALFCECVNNSEWREWLRHGLKEEMKRRRPKDKNGKPIESRLNETEQQEYQEALCAKLISFTYAVKRGRDWEEVRFCLGPKLHAALAAATLLTAAGELNLASLSAPGAEYFCEWLAGKWFEDFVLSKILLVKDECGLDECGVSLETVRETENDEADPFFEIDVVARRGYQLFALSCTLDSRVKECKHKLFEIVLRARQLGGGEARIGLVCLAFNAPKYKNLNALKAQLKDDHIEVFGNHNGNLESLETDLRSWFNKR